MKKIIVFTLLLFSIIASAQNDDVEDTTAQPAITEAGKPEGKIAEMKMNKDGGTLVSGDGKLELIIPSGALSKKTTISIQPVTNMMPNGNGQAYRLEPSGIQFQKPVQLIFHYTDEESADSAQLLMGIAMQDDKGQWFGLNKFTLDTVAKTISGNVHHFCAVCKFDVLKINPTSARVKINKSIVLELRGMEPFPKQTDGPDLTFLNRTARKAIWRVNNIVQGNSVVGTLKYGTADYFKPFNIYNAPASVPDKNPVSVSVKLQTVKYNGINFKDFTLVSNILIYDNAYEVKMTSYIDEPGSVVYRDTGSFVVSLNGKETKIIEKLNKNVNDEFNLDGGGCTSKQLEPGNGYIHMVGVQGITVTPATPTQPARVKIQFIPRRITLPLLKVTCTDRDGKTFTWTTAKMNAMWSIMHAYPQSIEFTAKEGEEEWEIYETMYDIPEGTPIQSGHRALLKYTVRKLKDNEY